MAFRLLKRSEILNANDTRYRVVEVPEWRPEDWQEGDEEAAVKIRSLTRNDMHSLRRKAMVTDSVGMQQMDEELLDYMLFVTAVVTEDEPFTVSDAELLKYKNSGAMQRVVSAIIEMSGLNPTSVKEAEKRVSE